MKKWMLAGLVVIALIVGGIIFATKGGEPVQEGPAAAETPAAAVAPAAPKQAEVPEEKPKPPQPIPPPPKENDKESVMSGPEVMKMTIEKFFSEFDKPGTEEKYKGETVQLLGEVQEIEEKSSEGYPVTFSAGAGSLFSGRLVKGFFQESPPLEPGQKVVFRGKVTERSISEGSFMEARRETITLINCILAPPIRISAEDLYSAFDRNPVAAELKYKIEFLEVTGEIGSIKSTSIILLRGRGEAGSIGVRLTLFEKGELGKIAAVGKGDTIRIRGILDTFRPIIALDVVLQHVRFLD